MNVYIFLILFQTSNTYKIVIINICINICHTSASTTFLLRAAAEQTHVRTYIHLAIRVRTACLLCYCVDDTSQGYFVLSRHTADIQSATAHVKLGILILKLRWICLQIRTTEIFTERARRRVSADAAWWPSYQESPRPPVKLTRLTATQFPDNKIIY